MMKYPLFLLSLLFMGYGPRAAKACEPPDPDCTIERLLAGQHTDIGEVSVDITDDGVNIEYNIDAYNWFLTTVHYYIGLTKPKKHAPGQFPFKEEDLYQKMYTASHDWNELGFNPGKLSEAGGCFYVAAHADVLDEPFFAELAASLPEQVTMIPAYPGADSYWEVTIEDEHDFLDGVYEDWCIDIDNYMTPGTMHTANVYLSYPYESLPNEVLSHIVTPGNLPKVNWIINQDFVGEPASDDCGGTYTILDVQHAIWNLVEGGTFESCRVLEIVAAAELHGDFLPSCGDVIAIILQPVAMVQPQITFAQITIAEFELESCVGKEETAWAEGERFPKSWAMYFECCLD